MSVTLETDFPPSFLFGSATAAHQVEGANVNCDWWSWEHRSDTVCAESSGDGIDHYHRYVEDFALLASLEHHVHRLSVEWARIEPARGEFSRAALAHFHPRCRFARLAEPCATVRPRGVASELQPGTSPRATSPRRSITHDAVGSRGLALRTPDGNAESSATTKTGGSQWHESA
ncbi:MAG: beta-glucosidase [Solirubrobacteraceae bacterium]